MPHSFSSILPVLFVSCLLFVTPPAMVAQQPPDSSLQQTTDAPATEVWNQTYGGEEIDHTSQAIQTTDGGFAFVGSTVSFSPSRDRYSAWFVKTDAAGTEQWNRSYPVREDSHFTAVVQNSEGGYTLAGWTYPQRYLGEGFLVKTNSTGHQQWNRSFGGAKSDIVYSMTSTDDGGYLVAGKTQSFGEGTAAWLVKVNATGHEIWNQTYQLSSYSTAQEVIQTPDGGYAFVGSASLYGSWLVKVNASGYEQWNQTYDGGIEDVIRTHDGGYALAGTTAGVNASTDAWIVKTNETGYPQWQQSFGAGERDRATSVVQTADDGFAVGLDLTPQGKMSQNIALVKLDAAGCEQWRWAGGAPLGGQISSVVVTNEGEFLLSGTYEAPSVTDAWLIKLERPPGTAD